MEKKIYQKPAIETLEMEAATLMAGSVDTDGLGINTGGNTPEPGNAYGEAASKGHNSIWDWGEE